MQIRDCPICGNVEFKQFKIINQRFHYVRVFCKKCHTAFFNKLVKIPPKYDYEYNKHFFRMGDITKAAVFGMLIKRICKDRFTDPRVLEIGVGNGLTLREVHAAQIACEGVDIDKRLCNDLEKHFGLNVHSGGIENFTTRKKFHLIFSSHVIEHFENPINFLRLCANFLDRNGVIFLDTPDISANKKLDVAWNHFNTRHPHEHTVILSPQSLAIAADKAGLKLESLSQTPDFGSMQALIQHKPERKHVCLI